MRKKTVVLFNIFKMTSYQSIAKRKKICWHCVQDSDAIECVAVTSNDHNVSINGLNRNGEWVNVHIFKPLNNKGVDLHTNHFTFSICFSHTFLYDTAIFCSALVFTRFYCVEECQHITLHPQKRPLIADTFTKFIESKCTFLVADKWFSGMHL